MLSGSFRAESQLGPIGDTSIPDPIAQSSVLYFPSFSPVHQGHGENQERMQI